MDEKRTDLSRRGFLAGSAALAAGATLALAGCAPKEESTGTGSGSSSADSGSWDKTVDIIVVGSGTAAVAMLAASHFGAETVLGIEKSPTFGGTSALSGGGVAIPMTRVAKEAGVNDSIEEVLKYYKSASNGRCDLDVARSYVENGDEFLKWTEDAMGFKWDFTAKMFQDYYEPCEGWLEFGRGNLSAQEIDGAPNAEMASGVWKKFRSMIDADEKIELLLETEAVALVKDASGRVTGLVAKDGRNEIRIAANKGVILGTGGFEHDPEMRKKYLPFPLLASSSVTTNTGDGHKMGAKIGADLANMDRNWGLPHFLTSGANAYDLLENGELIQEFSGMDAGTYRGLPGSVIVNKFGQRFGNECAAYPIINKAFGRFDTYYADYSNIPGFFICDSTYAGVYKLPGQKEATDPVPEVFKKGDTLEALADQLGIDAAGLVAEMTAFNENAKAGVDPKFNRGGHKFDINTSAVFGGMRQDLANPCLAPLETPPFYGAFMVPGTFGTSGGLKVDANSQVVDIDGAPIPGLYAVGNCSSGVSAGTYMAGGMTIGQGSVMSYVAARHALGA